MSRLARFARMHARLLATPAAKVPPPTPVPSHRPHHAVISLAGQDKVGIVNAVTSSIAQHHANLEHSKMAILGGDFAMILHLTLPTTDDADSLHAAIQHELPDFTVTMRTTTPKADLHVDDGPMWEILFEGPDQPGIVAAVTQALATHSANVHSLETETGSAPFAGYELFKMTGQFTVPDHALDSVSEALKKVEDRFGASIVINQVDTTS